MIPRLWLPQARPDALGSTLQADQANSHHIVRVLRLREGAMLQVFDGDGHRFEATLLEPAARGCTVRLDRQIAALPESPLAVTLVQGISAADRMDWTIEKAVELGVSAIVPLTCERSQVKLDAQRAQRRHEHWQRLIVAACMQCGRDRLPRLWPLTAAAALPAPQDAWPDGTPCPASTRLQLAAPGQLASEPLASEQLAAGQLAPGQRAAGRMPAAVGIQASAIDARDSAGAANAYNGNTLTRVPVALSAWQPAEGPLTAVTLAAGPESGFSPAEVNHLMRLAFIPCTLGPRVLRTETAGLAALAALQVKYGDF